MVVATILFFFFTTSPCQDTPANKEHAYSLWAWNRKEENGVAKKYHSFLEDDAVGCNPELNAIFHGGSHLYCFCYFPILERG